VKKRPDQLQPGDKIEALVLCVVEVAWVDVVEGGGSDLTAKANRVIAWRNPEWVSERGELPCGSALSVEVVAVNCAP